MKMRIFVIAVAAIFALAACSGSQTTNQNSTNSDRVTASPSAAPTADVMAAGRQLFLDNCSDCHKESGKGGPMEIEGKKIEPDDLTSDKLRKVPDDKFYRYIYNGVEDDGMPAFKDKLSEAEIREVVRYVRSELQGMPLAAPTKGLGVD